MPLLAVLRPSVLASLALHGALVVGAFAWVAEPLPEPVAEVSARFAYDVPAAEEAPIDPVRAADAAIDLPVAAPEVVVEAAPEVASDDLPAVEAPLGPEAPSLERVPPGLRVSRAGPATPAPVVGLGGGRTGGGGGPATAATPAAARVAPAPRGGITRPSRPVPSNARPVYPAAAVSAGLEGTVWLLVTVGGDGGVGEIAVDRTSGHAVLDDAALSAVRSWRYDPALADGEPVPERLLIPVRFVLHGA